MSSKKYILLKIVIIIVILAVEVSDSLRTGKKPIEGNNSTKLIRRGLLNRHGAFRNGITTSNVPKLRNIKRSPLSDANVGAIDDNTVDNKLPTSVTIPLDPDVASTLANPEQSQYAETIRKELMQKVLDSAMNKLKEMVIKKGGNTSSIPTIDPIVNQSATNEVPLKTPLTPIKPTGNHVATSKVSGSRKRFPTRQLTTTTSTVKPNEKYINYQQEEVSPSGPTIKLTVDPELEKTLTSGDPQYAETFRKEVMQKVLDSAMKKLKEMVMNKGQNSSRIPVVFENTTNQVITSRTPGVPRRFPTRQLTRTFPIIVRAPSTIKPSTTSMKPVSHNDTDVSAPNSPNEESDEHSRETDQPKHKKTYGKLATVVRLPPIHLKTSKLHPSPNYDDEDRSVSKEIIHDILDKDQFWRIIEDDDETSLDDTEELENEELLRLLEAKAKEKQNETTTTTTQAPPKTDLRVLEKTTAKPFDFKVPRKLRPEFESFFNSVKDFFVNIYNAISGGPWLPSLY